MPGISSFAEIVRLSEAQLKELLREVEIGDVIAAVRDEGAREVKAHLFTAIEPKVQRFIQEELDLTKEADLGRIKDAQQRMVHLASRLV